MLCATCEGFIPWNELPHDAGHDPECQQLRGVPECNRWCDLRPVHARPDCCDVCAAQEEHIPAPPAAKPEASRVPFAWVGAPAYRPEGAA